MPRITLIFAATVALIALAATTTPSHAVGYWNMPGSVCQWWGCGYGAGYHAPIVLGPISYEGLLATGERRLPYPPSGYCSGACENCNASGGLAPLYQPTVLPPPNTQPESTPAAYRVPVLR